VEIDTMNSILWQMKTLNEAGELTTEQLRMIRDTADQDIDKMYDFVSGPETYEEWAALNDDYDFEDDELDDTAIISIFEDR
jgi:hypothetical protein